WKPLHKLIYPAIAIAWVHFIWQARSDVGEMVLYGLAILLLLGIRWRWAGAGALIPFVRG
ncbi:MAG: hypothetical protein JJ855_19290, partial [Rhodospirillales bacterium]|nr:hypothetical protein [Rhodospirillales bacterium]